MKSPTAIALLALIFSAPLLAEDPPPAPDEPGFLSTDGATIQIGQTTSYFKLTVKVVKTNGTWDHNEVTVSRVNAGIDEDTETWNPAPTNAGMFWYTQGGQMGLQIYVGKPNHNDVFVAASTGEYGGYMAVMIGLSGDDVLVGSDNEDWILGNEGSDVILGMEDRDHIWGGAAGDALCGGDQDDEIVGGDGNDDEAFDNLPPNVPEPIGTGILGGSGDDKLWGCAGDDQVGGQDGDDHLVGGGGLDTLSGQGGVDKLWGGANDDSLDGGAGNDWLYGQEGEDQCYGDEGADHIYGGTENDGPVYGYIAGGLEPETDGADVVCGGSGNEVIYCGYGNDVVNGGAGQDLIYGESDNDDIWGGADWDEIHGGSGDDFIDGEGGGGVFEGDDGDDGLQEVDGQTQAGFDGGLGNDAINCFDENVAIEDVVVSCSGSDEQGNDEIWADEFGLQWSGLGDLVVCGLNDVWHVQSVLFAPASGNTKPQEP